MRSKTAILLSCLLIAAAFISIPSRAQSYPSYHVVHGWPILPEGFSFGEVSGVGVDSHNHVFVFHRGSHPIMCFDGETGRLINSWGDGMFATAHGLTVDSQDNIWVTDVGHHQVYKFSNDGKLLMTVGTKDQPGLDGTHFNKPTDVAVTPEGDFYVSDGYGNSHVAKFSADGKFLEQWKSEQLGRPWDVAVGPSGKIFVVDGGDMNPEPPDRGRVVILDPQGRALGQFGSFGEYDGQFYWAHQLAVAKNGDVYVVDVNKGMRAQKFVPDSGR